MTKEQALNLIRQQGANDAENLRKRANGMTGTEIIEEEIKIPTFDSAKNYIGWPVSSPVKYEGHEYALLQPYDASAYPDSNPANTPAIWSILHTKNPLKAKPFIAPQGTSGMYMKGDCCTFNDAIYTSLVDNNVWSPEDYPLNWEQYVEEE